MAKRRRDDRKVEDTGKTGESKTVAFQVRFDADLHEALRREAEQAGISLNQLIQGICRGSLSYLVQGEAEKTRDGFVLVKPQKGCVFFGRRGVHYSDRERQEFYSGEGNELAEDDPGALWFALDFTNRGVVRYEPR